MSVYREFRFFSPLDDAESVRLSVADERGREYYAIIEAGYGKRWRERRNTALDAIEEAIEAGLPPGEIGARTHAQSERIRRDRRLLEYDARGQLSPSNELVAGIE